MSDPLDFDFITDAELRSSLEADYRELLACFEGRSWKAVHVLSGSIVEAVLVDYLLVTSYTDANPLRMTLQELIEAAKAGGILPEKPADLSSVVRGYRNLTPPGRVKRLNETVDEDGPQIATAVVSLVVRAVG